MRFDKVVPLLPATAPAVRRALGGRPKAVAHYLTGAVRDGRLIVVGQQPERLHNRVLMCNVYAPNPNRRERLDIAQRKAAEAARTLAQISWLTGAPRGRP